MNIWDKIRVIYDDKKCSEELRDWIYSDICQECEKNCICKKVIPLLPTLIGCFIAKYPENIAKEIIQKII